MRKIRRGNVPLACCQTIDRRSMAHQSSARLSEIQFVQPRAELSSAKCFRGAWVPQSRCRELRTAHARSIAALPWELPATIAASPAVDSQGCKQAGQQGPLNESQPLDRLATKQHRQAPAVRNSIAAAAE